jgi:hypothetical protein
MAATGCDSGDTVLTMPEGGPASQPTAAEAGQSTSQQKSKTKPGVTSRRDLQKERAQQGSE